MADGFFSENESVHRLKGFGVGAEGITAFHDLEFVRYSDVAADEVEVPHPLDGFCNLAWFHVDADVANIEIEGVEGGLVHLW